MRIEGHHDAGDIPAMDERREGFHVLPGRELNVEVPKVFLRRSDEVQVAGEQRHHALFRIGDVNFQSGRKLELLQDVEVGRTGEPGRFGKNIRRHVGADDVGCFYCSVSILSAVVLVS